ncbi:MAG: NAD(P)H-dependent glycerol-3-phosphate dehydrogenase [Myxococcota bacterium]
MQKIAVIGAGAWGTALGHLRATAGDDVTMWAFEDQVVEDINVRHENRTFLPGVALPANLRASGDMSEVVRDVHLILIVCPSHVMRSVMGQARDVLPRGVPLVSAAKGIENESLMTMSEVLEEVLSPEHHEMLAYLSGPSFAKELAQGLPTAVSLASRSERVATQVQEMLATGYMRLYTSTDIEGVELGGALKNVMAIAAGAAAGLGLGYNTTTALITRGLAEMTRLAVKRGANPLTLAGLSGMGDLVLTCMGGLSRNRMVGEKLGKGLTLEEITRDMKQVAEGVKTAKSVHQLAHREQVEMPISEAVYRILYEGLPAREAVGMLMGRSLKKELPH